jgi:putative spermidine/putrescine transport system ATP-binding protein
MSKAAAIDIASVSKIYGNTTAVHAISLKIPAGSYCCLLGPSGCGKTSTLRMIAGHESISSGDVRLGNVVVTDLPPARRGTAMMFQSYALFPHLDLVDNVAFSLKMKGVDRPSFPAGSSSAWRWRARSSPIPRRCCWMSRCRHSILSSKSACVPS